MLPFRFNVLFDSISQNGAVSNSSEHFRQRKKYRIPIRISTLAGARHGAAFDIIKCGGEWDFDIRIVQRYTSAWDFLGDVMTVQYRQKFYISESYISKINCIYIYF